MTEKTSVVSIKGLPSQDPLAFWSGYMHGYSKQQKPKDWDNKSAEWQKGFQLGEDVAAGRAERPPWHT